MELNDLLENDIKMYIDVIVKHKADGRIIPLSFSWEDGTRYQIDKIVDVCRAASLKAGGTGLRYTVKVGNKYTFMWLEEDTDCLRWFMEKK